MNPILQAGLVFAALFALDFVWAFYTQALTTKRAARASGLASVLILLSGYAAVGYVNDPIMLIPAMAGAFAGTYAAMKWSEFQCQS